MRSILFLVAATALTGVGSAQCDLVNDNFNSVPSGTFLSSVPAWSVTGGGGAVLPPQILVDPSSTTPAARFPLQAAFTATRDLTGANLSSRFRMGYTFRAQLNARFELLCSGGTVSRAGLIVNQATGQIISLNTPTMSTALLVGTNQNRVEILVDTGGSYSVTVNGVQLHQGPWNPAGQATCVLPEQATFATTSVSSLGLAGMWIDDLCIDYGVSIGSTYCTANPNSTGAVGTLGVYGSLTPSNNDIFLVAQNLPPTVPGIALASTMQGSTPLNAGVLCLGGQVGRYSLPGQILPVDASGRWTFAPDLTMTPQPSMFVAVMAGETWNFQVWHRDIASNGSFTANFTLPSQVNFL